MKKSHNHMYKVLYEARVLSDIWSTVADGVAGIF